jgi:2-keto-4-pentenoate hydratase/2-oxohepta-3-ene-1,7-dioic acid hydratase in catechol pathway
MPVADIDPALPRTVRGLLHAQCLPRLAQRLAQHRGPGLACDRVRLGAPIPDAGKIICVGLNYRDHAAEQGLPWPERPLLFAKAPSALAGPTDDIVLPHEDGGPDYEVELALVVGQRCRRVAQAEAMGVIAGFMIGNDVTCRRWQKADGQWFRAKSCDTFYPCGPALVTCDEIIHPSRLRLTTTIGGVVLQDGVVSDLIHDLPALIASISRDMTLEAGDIISTGTPTGVGCYRNPPRFLQAGDLVECAIAGDGLDLGRLCNRITAASG